MLQDLAFGKLDNAFHDLLPADSDAVLCFCRGQVLLKRLPDDTLALPAYAQVKHWAEERQWMPWKDEGFRYAFNLQGINCFLWMGDGGECPEADFAYEPVRPLRQLQSKNVCFAIMTAWHLYNWYQSNRYCGRCGKQLHHDAKERMMRCDHCGNMIFPKISPAVIIALTDGDRLLLSKYAGRSYTRFALIAGYTEIGETLEQTVSREVMEEVGLRVKNIRFYKSQPWGVDGNVLMGFYCDLDGDDTIHLDETELSLAQWFPRDQLPAQDDGISLTREMIRVFQEGREPFGKNT